MNLKEFTPISELCLEKTKITKPKFNVFDIHSHWGRLLLGNEYEKSYNTADTIARFKRAGLKGIVNLDGECSDNLNRMLSKTNNSFIKTFGTLDVTMLDNPGFENYVFKNIGDMKKKGVCGLKFWKTTGLVHKDKNDNYIRPDDARLKCIWQTAAENNLPILFHIADPTAFFKPINNFNERFEELCDHPDWAFNSQELYKFEQLMEMQENLLYNNKKTSFIIAHVGSYSENLKQVGKWLDAYPNMYVDIAQRISELGRQPYTARKFFIDYADRILFGSDITPLFSENYYEIYYRFLETYDEYFNYDFSPTGNQGRWNIYGIGLPDDVLEKIYYKNAEKLINPEGIC